MVTPDDRSKLGLALSGGGHRAALFHLGVLARLAELGTLRRVRVLSTVSGGSIVGALYYLLLKELLEGKQDEEIVEADYLTLVGEVEERYRAFAARNLRGGVLLDYVRNFRLARPSVTRTDLIGELYERWLYAPALRGEDDDARLGPADPILMRDLRIRPKGAAADFHPERDNVGRRHAVPILLLNATTLNTGHNWRFEASGMGEASADEATARDLDKNVRLLFTRYEALPKRYAEQRLGGAVAASACFPGGFPPKALPGLFARSTEREGRRRWTVQLSDGGVHDNQGVDGLLDYDCTRLVVSDGAQQAADLERPSGRVPSVVGRAGTIARRASREQRLLRASAKADAAFVHLQAGLPTTALRPGQDDAQESGGKPVDGVDPEALRLLALTRTDLDAFSDIEMSSLGAAGHRIATPRLKGSPPLVLAPTTWRFAAVDARLAAPDPRFLRRLRIARLRFGKPLALVLDEPVAWLRRTTAPVGPVLAGLALVAVVALGLAAAGTSLSGETVPAPLLLVLGTVGIAAVVLYLKSETPALLRTVSLLLYDVLVPFLCAFFGIYTVISAGFVVFGKLHRFLGVDERITVGGLWARAGGWTGERLLMIITTTGIAVGGLTGAGLLADHWVNARESATHLAWAPSATTIVAVALLAAAISFGLELKIGTWRRARVGLALGVGIVLAAAGVLIALVVAAALLNLVLERGEAPQPLLVAYLTLVVIALVVMAIATAVISVVLVTLGGRRRGLDWGLRAAVGFVVLAALFAAVREPPPSDGQVLDDTAIAGTTERGDGPDPRYDVLLVLDPADPAVRRLIATAREHPERLQRPRPDGVRWDTGFGIATVSEDPDAEPPLLLAPTTDHAKLVARLAELGDRAGAEPEITARRVAYGPALVALAGDRGGWRRDTLRGLTIISDRAPAAEQLALAAGLAVGGDRAVPSGIREMVDGRARPDGTPLPVGGTVLNVLADHEAGPEWDRWAAFTGGTVRLQDEGASPLDEAEDALGRGPSRRELELATAHRPILLFDSAEREPPLDVDAFLAERGDDGHASHVLCRPPVTELGSCDPVRTAADLRPGLLDHERALAIDAHPVASRADKATDPFATEIQRMYYRITPANDPRAHRVLIDYWVFHRFNLSPSLTSYTCLAGLSIAEATCFDHEGDWEGVTVELVGGEVGSVTYAGHAWRYRYPWAALQRMGATEGARPRVWVAAGSHASYPAPCGKGVGSCKQLNSDLPDGRRNGRIEWPANDDSECERIHCVARLPLTREKAPAGWGAFGGRWGLARCTVGLKLCVRAAGPKSPAAQSRYGNPGGGSPAPRLP